MSIREALQKKSAVLGSRLTIHSTIRHRIWNKWCWRQAALNIARWTNPKAHGTNEMGCKDGLVSNLFNKAFYKSRLKPRFLSRATAQGFCNGKLAHWFCNGELAHWYCNGELAHWFSYLTTLWKNSGISRNRKRCIIWMNLASCRTTDRTQSGLKESRRRGSSINRSGKWENVTIEHGHTDRGITTKTGAIVNRKMQK
jgi:hypothetical protein